MANSANINRKALVKLLSHSTKSQMKIYGTVLQSYRAYHATKTGRTDMTQKEVVAKANGTLGVASVTQPMLSKLENGTSIPSTNELRHILEASGFDLTAGTGGEALFKLLGTLRDYSSQLNKLLKEEPK